MKNFASNAAVWVDDKRLRELKEAIQTWIIDNPNTTLDSNVLEELIKTLQTRKQKVIKRIEEIIIDTKPISALLASGAITEAQLSKLIIKLESDPRLTTLLI